jgi:glycosyltransferase involved in cell wall biosynthesis
VKDLTVIILTFNEERNIKACLDSFSELDCHRFVVDSYSSDNTLSILGTYPVTIVQHSFENYSKQRNWAQANSPFSTPWVFHIDAGERMSPELVHWLKYVFKPADEPIGYLFSRRTIFFNQWIRHGGHYPNFHLRLYKSALGCCENKVYDQHFIASGITREIGNGIDIIDTVTDNLKSFTDSHARWAVFEAVEMVSQRMRATDLRPLTGATRQRRRWMKNNVFQKAPRLLRPFLYFLYRYIIRLGFLDGRMGLVFHVLQGFWFRFLVDSLVEEIVYKMKSEDKTLVEIVTRDYGKAVAIMLNEFSE